MVVMYALTLDVIHYVNFMHNICLTICTSQPCHLHIGLRYTRFHTSIYQFSCALVVYIYALFVTGHLIFLHLFG